jgi:hypothetical protein
MTSVISPPAGAGRQLAERLGLTIKGTEGHDLECACVSCDSSDAFRVHQDHGIGQCYSCGAKFSHFQLAKLILGDEQSAWRLLEELGLEEPRLTSSKNGHKNNGDANTASTEDLVLGIVHRIAKMKGVRAEDFEAYGARSKGGAAVFPMFGPDGKPCSEFAISTKGGKGCNARGKPSGVFLPHENGSPRLPKEGEEWCLVEGVKDAAALRSLDKLAAGLPTNRLSAKFATLFNGVAITIVPDRDKAGEEGAKRTARVLHGFAEPIRIALLPGELQEKGGDDVRDILKQDGGRELVLNAIADARPWDSAGSGAGCRPTIQVDAVTMPVADTLHQVTDSLLAAGNYFIRADQLVVINNGTISSILSSREFAGRLNQHVEFFFIGKEDGKYKPLPPEYGNTWLNNHIERTRLPAIKLFTRNPVYTDDWRLVAAGFDAQSGIYYAGPEVKASKETGHLDALLSDFCFKNPADRTNYLGILLTAILVPRFIGSKPAALFNGNQPELGKSILAQIIAILRDGHPTETITYNPNDEEFEKRLGASVHRGITTLVIDNAKARGYGKSRGGGQRIESPCLERSITDLVLSFRLLGQSKEIRAENSHIFCITANTPDVSRDLVTRSVVINLYHEGDPAHRTFSIADPEGYAEQHRLELLGELVGMVERWKSAGMPIAKTHSRFNKRGWGNIVGGILETCGEPDFLANADEVAALLDETRREFADLVGILADSPQGAWTASELVDLCNNRSLLIADLGDGSPRSKATRMGTIAGRFVDERFPLSDENEAVFHRETDRKGNIYKVYVDDKVPNLSGFAEPTPNLEMILGSAR